MECRVIREMGGDRVERVLAPNRKDSVLHEHIRDAMPENYKADVYVQTAYQKGNIKNLSKDEMSVAIWSKVNTAPFREGIGKMDLKYIDKNGEPFFSVIAEKLGLAELAVGYRLSGVKGAKVFVEALEERGFIYRWEGGYRVSGNETIEGDGRSGVEQNEMKIRVAMEWLGVPEDFVSFEREGDVSYVRFDPKLFNVTERIRESNGNANTLSLVGFLKERFPQLKFEFVTAKEGRELFEQMNEEDVTEGEGLVEEEVVDGEKVSEEKRKEERKLPDFNRVNSFVHKGTVYLISERVTDEIVIEEALHPFVHTVAETNKELFDNLVAAARKEFPGLRRQIGVRYGEGAGFTEADRDEELVTQALSKTFLEEREENEESSWEDHVRKMMEWFAKLLKEFAGIVAGEDKLNIDAGMISATSSFTDLAKLLNTFDSKFIVNVQDGRASFSLSTVQEGFLREAMEQAESQLQGLVAEDLFYQDNPVVYDGDSRTYESSAGVSYESLSTIVDGRTKGDGKEGLERLFGKKAARVLEGLCLGKSFEQIKDQIVGVDEGIASRVYGALEKHLARVVNSNSVLLPYVVLGDHGAEVAGTLDIVAVEPDGRMQVLHIKVSPDSVRDVRYKNEEVALGGKSKWSGRRMTAHLQHGIKVGAATRLLENNGYAVERAVSVHIHLPEKKMREALGYDFKIEDTQVHLPSENSGWVDEVLPDANSSNRMEKLKKLVGKNNPVDDFDFLTEEEKMPEEELEEPLDKATVKTQKLPSGDAARVTKVIERLMKSVKFKPKSKLVQRLSELITFAKHDLSKGETTYAFGNFVRAAQEELEKINHFLLDDSKRKTDEYVRVAVEAEWYIKTYEGIVNAFSLSVGNESQSRMVERLRQQLHATESRIQLSLEEYVLNMTRSLSQQKLSNKDWEKLIEEAVDISKADYYFGDIDTSKDTLVAIAAKTYKMARLRAMERITEFEGKVKAAGNKLAEASGGGKPTYDWMIERNKKGEKTGRILQRIGPQLGELLDPLERKLHTSQGALKQYRSVYSLADADADDIAYNKELQKDKEKLRKFKEAEVQTATGYGDGNYYKLTDAFKAEREKNEEYVPIVKDGKFIKGTWRMKKGVDEAAYELYKRTYYNEVVYDKPIFEGEEFTGVFIKDGGKDWFVKADYIEVRDESGDGVNMLSKEWEKLQRDNSALGKARREFYTLYVTEMGDTLKILPPNVQQLMQGKMPRLRANFMQRIKKGANFFQN